MSKGAKPGGGFQQVGKVKKKPGGKPAKGAAKPKAMKTRAARKRRS
jgi:hypothetical protein